MTVFSTSLGTSCSSSTCRSIFCAKARTSQGQAEGEIQASAGPCSAFSFIMVYPTCFVSSREKAQSAPGVLGLRVGVFNSNSLATSSCELCCPLHAIMCTMQCPSCLPSNCLRLGLKRSLGARPHEGKRAAALRLLCCTESYALLHLCCEAARTPRRNGPGCRARST